MSTFTPSRPRRLLTILALAPGTLAALAVLATLVLLTADGHPEALLAAVAGAVVPAVIWYVWRLLPSAPPVTVSPPTDQAELMIAPEPMPASDVQWPPTRTISVPVLLTAH